MPGRQVWVALPMVEAVSSVVELATISAMGGDANDDVGEGLVPRPRDPLPPKGLLLPCPPRPGCGSRGSNGWV